LRVYAQHGIQFTKHFIKSVFVETTQVFGSNPNVILTWQTCGQHSGMAAGSKRRALAFYFPVLICCMFSILKCKGESDLGLCMTCQKNAAAQWQMLTNSSVKHVFKSEVATAQPHSFCKSRNNAQT